jgi:DNA repair photolyase
MRKTKEAYHTPYAKPLPKVLKADGQVLLSFATDPYCIYDVRELNTRRALELLLNSGTPVSILSKGGIRILRDMDLFMEFGEKIAVGQTLTLSRPLELFEYEPGAAGFKERIETFRKLKEAGVGTWASLEPVISPAESLICVEACLKEELVDVYKVGKLNHWFPELEKSIDWRGFLEDVLELFAKYGHTGYYIKSGLAAFGTGIPIAPDHLDPDKWMVQ